MTRSLIGVLCLGIAEIAALVGSCLLFHRRGYEKGYRDGFRAVAMNFSELTWRCDICHEERPDAFIIVHKVDITPSHLPPGTVTRNVKYCSDDPVCRNGALNWKER